ncbi:MAG TPA: type II toxin-antitoxin system death-on-curing family toxin [Gemmatimonadaceae bacterium]|jgi:death-on-curing protein|nr:type II toxin-antitoxin system death-on-curing family toxin [Gemmatimonadaceae bacterium]
MDEPTWVSRVVVDAMHTNQLQEHGGLQGTRDVNVLASALGRPQHKYAYEPDVEIATLAAAYVFGLATSHPYIDGNKRTAFVTGAVFLDQNGYDIDRSEQEVVETMLAVADRRLNEAELAAWIRSSLVPLPPPPTADTVPSL